MAVAHRRLAAIEARNLIGLCVILVSKQCQTESRGMKRDGVPAMRETSRRKGVYRRLSSGIVCVRGKNGWLSKAIAASLPPPLSLVLFTYSSSFSLPDMKIKKEESKRRSLKQRNREGEYQKGGGRSVESSSLSRFANPSSPSSARPPPKRPPSPDSNPNPPPSAPSLTVTVAVARVVRPTPAPVLQNENNKLMMSPSRRLTLTPPRPSRLFGEVPKAQRRNSPEFRYR